MIEGRDVICFSNDRHGDPLSKKHIMVRLARRNRVLWVNSIGNRNPRPSVRDARRILNKLAQFARGCWSSGQNIHVFSPIAIPFHGSRAARYLNGKFLSCSLRLVCRRLGFRDPISWTFLPSSGFRIVGRQSRGAEPHHFERGGTGKSRFSAFDAPSDQRFRLDFGRIESIRLKLIREGLEDYEYFTLLSQKGPSGYIDSVDKKVDQIVKKAYQWERLAGKLYSIREALARELEGRFPRGRPRDEFDRVERRGNAPR
jgi:hypothetical protein